MIERVPLAGDYGLPAPPRWRSIDWAACEREALVADGRDPRQGACTVTRRRTNETLILSGLVELAAWGVAWPLAVGCNANANAYRSPRSVSQAL